MDKRLINYYLTIVIKDKVLTLFNKESDMI